MPPLPVASYPLTLVDVFAARPMEGTLLAVIHDADALSAPSMQQIAHRLRLPETSFLLAPPHRDADYRHRIFTIEAEIPFAGHPSLGAAAAHAYRRGLRRTEFAQLTEVGLQPLSVDLDGDGNGTVRMRQNDARLGEVVDLPDLIEALGLDRSSLDDRLPTQLATTGLPTLIVPVRDVAALAAIRIDCSRFSAAVSVVGSAALNCYVVAAAGPGVWRARCFATDITGGEDPATGSAAGPLGAYLRHYLGVDEIIVEQGVEMGSRSRIEVEVREGVVVSGSVWLRGTGQILAPADHRP